MGRLNNSSEPLKTASWREVGIPWPVNWKNPVVVQAFFMAVTIFEDSGEVGSER